MAIGALIYKAGKVLRSCLVYSIICYSNEVRDIPVGRTDERPGRALPLPRRVLGLPPALPSLHRGGPGVGLDEPCDDGGQHGPLQAGRSVGSCPPFGAPTGQRRARSLDGGAGLYGSDPVATDRFAQGSGVMGIA